MTTKELEIKNIKELVAQTNMTIEQHLEEAIMVQKQLRANGMSKTIDMKCVKNHIAQLKQAINGLE